MNARLVSIVGISALLGGAFFGGVVTAQHEGHDHQSRQAEMTEEQMYAMWMEYAKPGEAHQRMAEFAGSYVTKAKHWMGPDAPPQTMEMISTSEPIYGGRYMLTEVRGEWMDQPFKGREIMGYDNMSDEYFAVWIDNLGTGVAITRGTWDTAKNALVMEGEMSSPMGPMKMRSVIRKTPAGGHMTEMYIDQGRGMYKSMEMRARRVD